MNLIALLMMAADPSGQPLPDVVLLDFTASYCKHCQDMAPALQRMEQSGFPIQEIDTTQHPEITRQHRVDRLPTFILLVEGTEVRRFVGLTAERDLRRAMNDAAEKLDLRRRAAAGRTKDLESSFEQFEEVRSQTEPPPAVAAAGADSRSGIGGFFDRVRNGLTGNSAPDEPAEVRAQSPDAEEAEAAGITEPLPKQATVRVHLADGKMRDVGTGTIVHSIAGQSTVLTCAHIFKDVSADAKVKVEVFTPTEILTYDASVVGGSHDSDLAFLQIKNRNPLPTIPLQPGKLSLKPDETLYSYGCNGGALPTLLSQQVVKVNYFEGAENIVCNVAPKQGRSGGGLFNSAGELVGVCSGAFRQAGEGLYTGVGAVRELMAQLSLDFSGSIDETAAFANATPEPDPREIPNPFAQAEAVSAEDPFADLFDESDSAFDQQPEVVTAEASAAPAFSETSPAAREAVPVAMSAANRTNSAAPRTAAGTTEVTVIINDPVKGRRVVVIPKPSPWLLEMLTGEPAGDSGTAVAARQRQVSATSNRQSAQKPPAASGQNPVRSMGSRN